MPHLCLLLTGLLPTASAADLVVHEWGTFTAVAGQDGEAMVWKPLSGPQDLPSFVYDWEDAALGRRKPPPCRTKGCAGTVRMETPVIYFHTDEAMQVEVTVEFPRGTMTEWYPKAWIPASQGLHWGVIQLDPDLSTDFIHDGSDSHYYPARETSATPLRVCDTEGTETERFLFYRGVGDFPLSLNVQLHDRVYVEGPAGRMLVFDNREGARTWTWIDHRRRTAVERPVDEGTLDELLPEIVEWLVAEGLYEDEAWAMVRTWEDSWFEEGLRVLYVLPDREVRDLLPLSVSPYPTEVERVLVGRVEVITPEMQAKARTLGEDPDAWEEAFGRFAEPVGASLSW